MGGGGGGRRVTEQDDGVGLESVRDVRRYARSSVSGLPPVPRWPRGRQLTPRALPVQFMRALEEALAGKIQIAREPVVSQARSRLGLLRHLTILPRRELLSISHLVSQVSPAGLIVSMTHNQNAMGEYRTRLRLGGRELNA